MIQKLFRWAMLSLMVSAQPVLAQCVGLVDVPLAKRVKEAQYVVEGQVTARYSLWTEDKKSIYTVHEVQATRMFKGDAPQGKVLVLTEGGRVGNVGLEVSPNAEIRLGDRGVFLVNTIPNKTRLSKTNFANQPYGVVDALQFLSYNMETGGVHEPFKEWQSVDELALKLKSITGKETVLTTFEVMSSPAESYAVAAISFSPTSITAGTRTILTISDPAATFGTYGTNSKVSFIDADKPSVRYNTPSTEIISWTPTQIQLYVPTRAGTGTIVVTNNSGISYTSAGTLTVSYALLTVAHFCDGHLASRVLIDANGSGGYTMKFNASFGASGTASVEAAMSTWRAQTGFNIISGGTTSLSSRSYDSENVILWESLGTGILGKASAWWYENPDDCGEEIFPIVEFDVAFNPTYSWYYGMSLPVPSGQYDLQTVALHELGHTHQLGHINASGTTMHYATSVATAIRTPNVNEVSGANQTIALCDAAAQDYLNTWFGLSCMTPLLPVSLTSFDVRVEDGGIALLWSTASEQDNYGFDVEHKEGNDPNTPFTKIGFVNGNGTSIEHHEYNYWTKDLLPGLHTFRLKQLDRNGSVNTTPELEIVLPVEGAFANTSLYPNPFGQQTRFKITVAKEQRVRVSLVNLLGQRIRVMADGVIKANEINTFEVAGSGLPAGTYYVSIEGEFFHETLKGVVVR